MQQFKQFCFVSNILIFERKHRTEHKFRRRKKQTQIKTMNASNMLIWTNNTI